MNVDCSGCAHLSMVSAALRYQDSEPDYAEKALRNSAINTNVRTSYSRRIVTNTDVQCKFVREAQLLA